MACGVLRDGGSPTLKWGVSTNNDLNVGGRELVLMTSGNVGLGTAAPVERLDVAGAIKLGTTTGTTARHHPVDRDGL